MTRLTRFHIEQTLAQLHDIDERLRIRVNTGLLGVALRTIGVEEKDAAILISKRVAVVPLTLGQGVIPGFSESVAAIARHIHLDAVVTQDVDVSGIAGAFADGSDIVVLADDARFVAINIKSGAVADNDRATGEGFAALLCMMAGDVAGQPCGVIGCGPVGTFAALRLARMGANLTVCDSDARRGRQLVGRIQKKSDVKICWVDNVAALLSRTRYVVDASPASDIISAENISPDTVIAAPGVPLGLTSAALNCIGTNFYHDNLPLGVATMLLSAFYGRMVETRMF